MNAIKKITASLLLSLAVLLPTVVNAQNSYQKYSSKDLGISVEVPSNAKVDADNSQDGLILTADENSFVFAAVPFDVKSFSNARIAEEYAKFAKSARIDLDKSINFKGKTETIDFEGDIQDFPSGGSCLVSKVYVRGSKQAFFLIVTGTAEYVQCIHTVFRTINSVK